MNDLTQSTDQQLLDSFAAYPAARVRAEILRRMAFADAGSQLEPGDIEVTPVPPAIQAEIERILRERGVIL